MSKTSLFRAPAWLAAAAAVTTLAGCSKAVVLNPAGDVASQQGLLVVQATVLMLIIIVPVIALTLWFAWKYRHNNAANTEDDYDPEWHHSTTLELVIWTVPLLIIIALGALTWIGTHKLDPYRPLDRISATKPLAPQVKPLEVQVVAMDWKWLFFYPEQGIATVNELAAPVDRPIIFKLTATSTMNAFFVPDLAGMIYAMPGMQTELNAVINKPGVYKGLSSHYSGAGFSGMTFKFHGLSDADFAQWVQTAKTEGKALDKQTYLNLVKPSTRDPVQRFGRVEDGLYNKVLNRCVEDGQMCMHHMMVIDERGGEAYMRAAGLNLPQDVCTSQNAAQVMASLEAQLAAPAKATAQ
ncbi:MAG: ubiquinol oxidase subunit II [Acidovorax sp.]|jgi:cytochrome o ubiquinol oxidase subunit 2|uniref:ubiquinol oxidase subunit II n=1 Tax=Acidovorax sp. TaxID=1872122 RepID=UPI000A409A05|nr:ubiquinol oxidase subunit II [Acidovorax sp.]MCO4094968.1 ubiquinol oxidase subunit II [Acidovorax sp.]MDH4427247.1 ubiquinol oxidase subunit II [Acidovorax sp.]MDH4446200.1 ubiquinol oxidase subunit II [Acidovorax sp.]MDH4464691.1 ubiquinol oxidase subunit II [Acidovorax sp.]